MEQSDTEGHFHSCQKWKVACRLLCLSGFYMSACGERKKYDRWDPGDGPTRSKGKQLKALSSFSKEELQRFLPPSRSPCVNEDVDMTVMQSISSASFYLHWGRESVSVLPLCLDVVTLLLGRHWGEKGQILSTLHSLCVLPVWWHVVVSH